MKPLCMVKYDLKGVLNFIQRRNNCGVQNKYDLIFQTYFMLKYLNQNILNKRIIVTVRNQLLKV